MCGFAVYTGGDVSQKLDMAQDFTKIQYRGPDNTQIRDFGHQGWMGFHRLKIMDLSDAGNQPLKYRHLHLVCNGEVRSEERRVGKECRYRWSRYSYVKSEGM